MTDLNILAQLYSIGFGLWAAYTALRMLLAPRSLRKQSMLYRFMVYRLGLLNRTVAKTGQLNDRQIRAYGAGLLVLAVLLIVYSLL